jgi:hypothetical protein
MSEVWGLIRVIFLEHSTFLLPSTGAIDEADEVVAGALAVPRAYGAPLCGYSA